MRNVAHAFYLVGIYAEQVNELFVNGNVFVLMPKQAQRMRFKIAGVNVANIEQQRFPSLSLQSTDLVGEC